ncbi:MAG: SH3 domain-containing protein [Clostridia bacterium]|nr:SH3 domain-containing protein [Clostridia bacterium]
MICRKCSFILQGSEKFCPNCGADCSQKQQTEKTEEIQTPTPPSILFSAPKEREEPAEYQQRIFREEPEDTEETVRHKKSKAPAILIALLIVIILSVGGVTAMEYLGLAPVIMQYLETGGTVEESDSTTQSTEPNTTEAEYPENYGIVSPDVNFRPTICYVATDSSLALRKGPDSSYAPIDFIESGSQLQVIGASNIYDTWVYVYVPYTDCYGWISSSFLSETSVIENTDEATEEETTQEIL